MILQSAEKLNVDLTKSYMIGDWHTDIEAGKRAGVTPVLVLSGRGQKYIDMIGRPIGTIIFDDLLDFTNTFISMRTSRK
jgi:D-glycero-D-manno-heptose 1,7-bisphosphate phosphatase